MKKNIRCCLTTLLLLSMLLTCALPAKAAPSASANEPLRVLLVGNSLTGRNNLPRMLTKLSNKNGRKVKVTSIAKGHADLVSFATSGSQLNRKFRKALSSQKWDYVIFQDRHIYPVLYIGSMRQAGIQLCRMAKKAGAQPMLYMTWAPVKGHRDYKRINGLVTDREDYQAKIAASYEYISSITGAPVIPVGYAFLNGEKTEPDIRLIAPDKYHPSRYGSYLAACCIYTALFDESPEISKTSDNTARLQSLAWNTWLEYQGMSLPE